MSEGVVYIASGRNYIQEAVISAKSLKEAMPNVPVTIYTDQCIDHDVFDSVVIKDGFEHHAGDSIISPDMCPYDYNLFLDTDTYVSGDLQEIFDILDKFELGVCFGSGRVTVDDVPDCMPEYNTGVIAYRNSDSIKSFFQDWQTRYDNHVKKTGEVRNQAAFTKTLWNHEVNFLVLPQEYNVRVYPGRGAYLTREAKIIHGRHPQGLAKCASVANSKTGVRAYYQDWFFDESFTTIRQRGSAKSQLKDLAGRTNKSIKQDGIWMTAKKIFRYLS